MYPRRDALAKSWFGVLLATAVFATPSAFAQATPESPPAAAAGAETKADDAVVTVDKVSVTGSRIRRSQAEGPSPVTVITGAQIEREGFTTVADVLNSLSQNNTAVFSGDQLTNSFTKNLTPVDLRGLGPAYTLTLVDGRRVPNYPGAFNGQSDAVNVGAIPTVLIERIEILSGGASAIYGSDAVAGVINIILKEEYDGTYLSARVGETTEGGGKSLRYQLGGGINLFGNRFKSVYGVEYLRRNPIYAFQRDQADSSLDAPTVSGRSPARAYLILDDFGQGDTVYIDPGAEVCNNFLATGLRYTSRDPQGQYCGSTTYNSITSFRNSDDAYSGILKLSYDVVGQHQVYLFGSIYDQQAESLSGAPFWFSGSRAGTIVDASRPDAFGIGGQAVTYQRLFTPEETGSFRDGVTRLNERNYDFGGGLRGPIAGDFEYDVYVSSARNSADEIQRLLVFDAVEAFFLGQPTGQAGGFLEGAGINTYIPNMNALNNPITPDIYRSLSDVSLSRNFTSQKVANATVTGSLFQLPAGPLQMAGVLEVKEQAYELDPDPGQLPDQMRYFGTSATGGVGERDIYAAGLELRIPIVAKLSTTAAFRYDKYDDVTDVDDALSYNFGFEFRPMSNLLLRGTAATAFRAPDMHFVFAGESGFFTVVDDYYKCRQFEPDAALEDCSYADQNPSGTRRGNRNLKEEDAITYTAGIVLDVTQNLNLTVDYFNIEIEDLVGDESITDLLIREADCRLGVDEDGEPVDANSQGCRDALDKVSRLPATGDENGETLLSVDVGPVNQSVLRTEGVDVNAKYRWNLGQRGVVKFDLGWTHTVHFKFKQFDDDPLEDINGVTDTVNDGVNYRSRMRGSVNWDIDKWDLTLFAQRFGTIPNETGSRRLPAYLRYNASIRYEVNDILTLSVIGNNIFDRKPERDPEETFFPYFDTVHYDITGREVFAQAEFRF
ncbi:MAG: TonB-dependent receptor domain-containing protein [Panacagrimonas sp.]